MIRTEDHRLSKPSATRLAPAGATLIFEHRSFASTCSVRLRASRIVVILPLLALLWIVNPGLAQTSQPSIAGASVPELETKALNFDPSTVRRSVTRPAGSTLAPVSSGDLSRMVVALAAVVGIIFLLRWVARRMALVPGATRSGAVKIISRSTVSPRQQVLVLQVGKRLVVVGDSGGAMHPLCEITDPDEIAAVVGGSRQENAEANPKSFTSLFRRASEPFDPGQAEQVPAIIPRGPTSGEPLQNIEPVGQADNEDVGSLLEKVREMRAQFRQTGS